MSRFEKIVRFIGDIDIKTEFWQNSVFLVAILFITYATGHYKLKLIISYFLAIMGLFFVILAIVRHFYNIKTKFTILGQSVGLLICVICVLSQSFRYRDYKSFRKGLVYEKMLPDSLFYYHQQGELDNEIDGHNYKFTINFFQVFDDIRETRDILCLIKKIDKKTKREEIMLASFEETLAIFSTMRYKNTKLYDIWLKHAECLAKTSNDKVYKTMIDTIKDFKKRNSEYQKNGFINNI